VITIQLSAIPNQSFSIRLDDHFYDITIKSTNGCMSVTIARDNIVILSNQRAVAGFPIIPYHYLESGNFIFLTQNDDLPDYTQFGITQSFVFISQSELDTFRGKSTTT